MNFVCEWNGLHLWKGEGKNGLALDDTGLWHVIDTSINVVGSGHTKDYLLAVDRAWSIAFVSIEQGYKPSWCKCTCGANAVMGNDWEDHDQTCDSKTLPSPFAPKNNDGRTTCYNCGDDTKPAGGGQYLICKNKNCEWFDK